MSGIFTKNIIPDNHHILIRIQNQAVSDFGIFIASILRGVGLNRNFSSSNRPEAEDAG